MADIASAPTQTDLINQQFTAAQGNLNRQRQQAQDTLDMQVARQKAVGGLTGGGAIKAQELGQNQLTNTMAQSQAGLDVQKSQQLQQGAQFDKAFGLQQNEFNESQRQFDEQLKYQLKEFNENQVTNFVNAMTAFNTAGLGNPDTY